MDIKTVWNQSLKESIEVAQSFISDPQLMEGCEAFSKALITTFKQNGKALSCGNGGSHCDAMHFAEEFTGRYRKDRKPLAAMALGDSSHVTCVANDYGFEFIFSRQVEAFGRNEDLLIGLSTSGNSKNVIRAVEAAKKIGMKTVGLLGKSGGELRSLVDIPIVVPAHTSDRVQELHIKILHIVIETVERELFPDHYTT